MNHPDWHLHSAEEVCEILEVSPDRGLGKDEVLQRTLRYGKNEIREGARKSPLSILFAQVTDFMILVLLGAALLSGFMGEYVDAIAILIIVLLNAVIGFTQEYRADRAIAALRTMATPNVMVLRDGLTQNLSIRYLVPGDIVFTEAGCVIPADMRIISQVLLHIDESALTGESMAQEKNTDRLQAAGGSSEIVSDIVLGDRKNMAYKGTRVVKGRGRAVVTATGMQTELGKIAGMLSSEEGRTPLQKRLVTFGKRITYVILAACLVIFLLGLLRSVSPMLMFLTAVSLAVAAIPEALPAVISIALALGARKMVAKNALVRSLPAVETLGSITYICTDKTGTLTSNIMQVERLFINGQWTPAENFRQDQPGRDFTPIEGENRKLMAMALILNSDAKKTGANEFLGEPTETALLKTGFQYGESFFERTLSHERLSELPFDSDRKRMSTIHRYDDGYILFTKGAPEVLLDRCSSENGRNLDTLGLQKEAGELARKGYRVILFACKKMKDLPRTLGDADESELTFLGLAAMMDPPRENARDAVELCNKAGIVTVMVTGDHPETAKHIAMQLSIAGAQDRVITGQDLQKLSDEEFAAIVKQVRVYARVSPLQKIRIVKALQAGGEYVAMTGDGINDAPALKLAEIGIAMGKKGTDVARESSDIILIDDNFSTIVAAVAEGRQVYDNVRKFIRYILSGNLAEILTLTAAPFLGMPIPLLPIQILWINLVTDSLPALALAGEKAESDIMALPPRPPGESIFARGLGRYVVAMGVVISLIVLVSEKIFMQNERWQTIVFTVLSFSQLMQTFAIRSERTSMYKAGFAGSFLKNRWLVLSVLLMFIMQLGVIYLPVLNTVFKTSPLSAKELLFCFTIPWLSLVAAEIIKMIDVMKYFKLNEKKS